VVYNRFNRWSKTGVWEKVLTALAQDPYFEYVMVNSSVVRAHQHAAGVKGISHGVLNVVASSARLAGIGS